jgi:PIN domain nuclease of toxin-antitoxin system
VSYLVDTNAWIALFEDAPILSDRAATLMESSSNACHVSVASVWEAAIKVGIGKLRLPYDLEVDLPRILEENGFALVGIDIADAVAVKDLSPVHGDPFDRIQVAQARRHGWTVISRDPIFERYGLRRVW